MDRAERPGSSWQSPAAMPRPWLAGVFAASAVYAILVVVVSSNSVHQTWGTIAACGYGLATITALVPRGTALVPRVAALIPRWAALGPRMNRGNPGADLAVVLAFCGGLVVPLCWLVARGLRQPEVMVIARSGVGLIHHGAPYPGVAALAGTSDPNAYNPYLPVMSLFGVPRALANSLVTDPRIWFGLVFVIVFWLALLRAGARDPARWTALVAGCPVIAFTLATGGVDAPMVAFLCLGFAYLWQSVPAAPGLASVNTGHASVNPGHVSVSTGHAPAGTGLAPVTVRLAPVKAGLALGIAAAMKATAWPAIAVGIAFLAVACGRRAAVRFTLTAAAVVVVCIGPFLVLEGRALIENTVEFPLGLEHIVSAAASPLPGYLIAQTGHAGHTIVVALLAVAGVAVAASLVFRPPRTVPRAMGLLIGAMTLMFLLAPSTRYGYFIYPLSLVIWLLVAMAGRRRPGQGVAPGPGEPLASSHRGS
jgi:hypothetical protein